MCKSSKCECIMQSGNRWEKDELLADMEQSIERAMDEHMADLAGALMRLNASARGWCDKPDCDGCPLAVLMCQTDMEKRVNQLIREHHARKKDAARGNQKTEISRHGSPISSTESTGHKSNRVQPHTTT